MSKLLSELAKGAWSAVTAYTIGDIVDNNGSSYVCIANSTNNEPPNVTYWALLAEKGDTGAAGNNGQGVPVGGTTGQVLAKASATNYDTAWVAAGAGDMAAAVYDPQNVAGDAFDTDNHTDGTTNKVFTASEKTKLAGIETAADVTDATNVAAAGAVMDSELIATSAGAGDAGKPIKLDAGGKVDASMIEDSDISLDNVTEGTTNKFFTATLKTKLDGIEALADVTDAGNVGSSIHGATGKTTPVDADTVPLIDSEASNVLKKLTWANLKATLKIYFDSLYELAGAIATHAALTATHGVVGAIVGTSDAQTLTNKTLTSPKINENVAMTASATELNVLDGIPATLTATELGYVDGVTSAIQTQLNAKAPLASPSFTGTVTLPIGLTGVLRADTGVVSVDTDITDLVSAASTTAAGKVELATTAETETGTDTARAVTPDGLHDMTTLAGAAWFLDEDDMVSNSAVKTASQQSIKAYVDTAIAGASGSPGGSNTQVQFNDGGAFGGDAGLVYNKTTDALTLGGNLAITGVAGQTNVFNESGADQDTRVEGDTDVNLLFIDASTDRVGIGTATPGQKLEVNGKVRLAAVSGSQAYEMYAGTLATDDRLIITDVSGGDSRFWFDSSSGSTGFSIAEAGTERVYMGTESGDFMFESKTTYGIKFRTQGGTERMKIFSDGTTVFNDPGNDQDFRVESDTKTHMFFVDAGNDRIGINNSAPAYTFDIAGNASVATTSTITSGEYNAFNVSVGLNPVADSTGRAWGMRFDVYSSAGSGVDLTDANGSLTGFEGLAHLDGAGTISVISGGLIYAAVGGGGTVTTAYGLRVFGMANFNTGTITNAVGLEAKASLAFSANTQKRIGLLLEGQPSPGAFTSCISAAIHFSSDSNESRGGMVFRSAGDTNLYSVAANVLKTDDQLRVSDGITTKIKAGIPADGDFTATPESGTIAVDTTNSRIYVRVGSTWKYAALT